MAQIPSNKNHSNGT